MTKVKAFLDNLLGKFISRKLLVFGICTWALLLDKVPADQWVNVAMIYIGGQSIVDITTILKAK